MWRLLMNITLLTRQTLFLILATIRKVLQILAVSWTEQVSVECLFQIDVLRENWLPDPTHTWKYSEAVLQIATLDLAAIHPASIERTSSQVSSRFPSSMAKTTGEWELHALERVRLLELRKELDVVEITSSEDILELILTCYALILSSNLFYRCCTERFMAENYLFCQNWLSIRTRHIWWKWCRGQGECDEYIRSPC